MKAIITIEVEGTPEFLGRLIKALEGGPVDRPESLPPEPVPKPVRRKKSGSKQCVFMKRKWGDRPPRQCENGVWRKCKSRAVPFCRLHCFDHHDCLPKRSR